MTQEFYKIIVDKHNPDTIYLAAQNDGVLISYDMGGSWESWTEGLTNRRAGTSGNNIANPLAQSADGLYLYFGTFGSGVFRRTTYIPPTTTTTTTTTPPTPFPMDMVIVVVGGAAVVIVVLVLIVRKRR